MTTIDGFTPAKASGMGVLLAVVNPKNLLLGVAAALMLVVIAMIIGLNLIILAMWLAVIHAVLTWLGTRH